VFGSSALWALVGSDLVRIDVSNGAASRLSLQPPHGASVQPQFLVSAGGDLWVSAFGSDTSQNRLDPR
jgi:hypothetical protein